MIKSNTAERVADVNDAAGGGAGPNTSFVGGMRTLAMALGATALTAVTAPAQGGLISGTYTDHQTFGANYLLGGSAVAATGGATVGVRAYSSLFAGGQQNTTGTLISDRYVLIGYHQVSQILNSNPTFEISTGPNAQTNRGTVMQVSRLITFPNGSQLNPSLPDYALLELTSAIAGVVPVTIGSAVAGQTASSAGFGSWANPGGTFVRTFDVLGGVGPIRASNLNGYSSQYYFQTDFLPGILMNWRGGNGDSGSPAFGQNGELLGIGIAATIGSGIAGQTTFLRLDNPSVYSDLAPYIPSPASSLLLGLSGLMLARRRR